MAKKIAENKQIELGKATAEQMASWLKEHNLDADEVYGFVVYKGDTAHYGYVKQPKRAVIARALTYTRQDKIYEAGELILAEEWLGGSELLRSKESLKSAACVEVSSMGFLPAAQQLPRG